MVRRLRKTLPDTVRLHPWAGSRLPVDTRGANPRQHRRVHPLMAMEVPACWN